ncbi:unnamed protein product [Adineta steineri]|uniref:Ig-like domain-containing protein n=1 Tax=Adineta steineri TaxID=433720 RepID=A0A813X504_9BILA|nr:unnamed protein product [Adineta steineri]CAF1274020.1 unnamed protein product [Adineta steineri]
MNQKNVEIIPCLITVGWSPKSTWLKSLIDGINNINFGSTDDIRIDHAITKLAQRIVDIISVSKMMKPSISANFIIPPISQEKKPNIMVDLSSSKIIREGDPLELRLVTDGLGAYNCKWCFNEQDIMLNNSETILRVEDHDRICCLRIENFQARHAGEYQAILSNATGVIMKSKNIICTMGKSPQFIVDENEPHIIGVHGEDCVIRCQIDAIPEAIVTWYVSYSFVVNFSYEL